MRILAIERELPTPPYANFHDLLRDEAASVWDLQKRGIVRDVWFTIGQRRAVIMLECANAAEARQHLAALPLVRHGLIEFTLLELQSYDGVERLFTSPANVTAAVREEPPEY
jgi:muconolactone delta-isomerase